MKKKGSRNANASVAKNTAMKMLSMPFCAYLVQISTTFLLSATEAFSTAFEIDVGFNEFNSAISAGGYRLRGSSGEPIDHGAAGDQAEKERGVQKGELVDICSDAVGERHDDGENHGGSAHDGGADEHGLGGSFEGVAGAVICFEQVFGALEIGVDVEIPLDFLAMLGICSISESS